MREKGGFVSVRAGGVEARRGDYARLTSLFGTSESLGLHGGVHARRVSPHRLNERDTKWCYAYVRPVDRFTPARKALIRRASKPRWTSFPSIVKVYVLGYVCTERDRQKDSGCGDAQMREAMRAGGWWLSETALDEVLSMPAR